MKTLAAVFVGLLLVANTANARVFNFIYVEAGEGNSSGGHAAVQFDKEVFHFQYADGLLRLFKLKAANFRRHYQLLQNRNLHLAAIEVSDDTYELLLRRFKERFLEQKQHLKVLNVLEQNQALLQTMLELKGASPPNSPNNPVLKLRLPGAGLFYRDETSNPVEQAGGGCDTTASSAKIISKARQVLENRLGKFYLSRKISALKAQLATLSPRLENSATADQYLFSERYSDLSNELLALQVLQNDRPLVGNACFEVNLPETHLTEKQAQNVLAWQQGLLDSALSLVASKRPDKGYALMVSLARLIAIEQTIQSRHWVFLDDTNEAASVILQDQLMLYAEDMRKERESDAKRFKEAIAELSQPAPVYDQLYQAVEVAANRMRQWQLSDKNKALRYHSEQALPTKSVPITPYVFSGLPVEQLKMALTEQNKASQLLMQEDVDRNTYHLVTHNCVSALFVLIDEAVGGQSAQRLGGYIDPQYNFIPFRAFDSVTNTYHVIKTEKLPSYREQKLAEMYTREDGALVYVREANIFSSRLYHHNPDDAWFVFFTDDATFLRPLYGAVNTLSAASQSLVGLFTWPFDEGRHLKTGAKGVVASLPELAFFNIRKGSYPYALDD